MKLKIDHLSRYTYQEKVSLNPHDLYLIPQQRSYIKILDAQLDISPNPLGKNERINAEGNPFYQVWFGEDTSELVVRSSLQLEISKYNPYGFILHKEVLFPFDFFVYPDAFKEPLRLFIEGEESNEKLKIYTQNTINQTLDFISFLTLLVANIHQDWKHIIRMEEGLMTIDEMIDQKEGSCRDLSWLLIQMLRSVGLASRFVSGYAFNPELDEGHELHAWVEVFLPGAGWIGLDPSLGLLADQNYIPLACSFHPLNTLPIYGSYGGTGSSHLTSEVIIKEVKD